MHCTKDTFDGVSWKIWWTDGPDEAPIGSGATEREAKEDAVRNMELAIARLMGARAEASVEPPALHLQIAKELDNLAKKMLEKSFGEVGTVEPASTPDGWDIPAQALSNALNWSLASASLQSAVQYLAKIK